MNLKERIAITTHYLSYRRGLENGASFSNSLINGSEMDTRLWRNGLLITSEHDKRVFKIFFNG